MPSICSELGFTECADYDGTGSLKCTNVCDAHEDCTAGYLCLDMPGHEGTKVCQCGRN